MTAAGRQATAEAVASAEENEKIRFTVRRAEVETQRRPVEIA